MAFDYQLQILIAYFGIQLISDMHMVITQSVDDIPKLFVIGTVKSTIICFIATFTT